MVRVDRMAVSAEAVKEGDPPRRVLWWPAVLAILAVGGIYLVISAQFVIGPSWLLLALGIVSTVSAGVMHWAGFLPARRYIALGTVALFAVTVSVSAFFLISGLATDHTAALPLLRDGGLVWVCNIVTFSLWYWELDAGGPAARHATATPSTDFLFPQMTDRELGRGWLPEYLDYLFLAFNHSSAFSPTDTMVLARRAKLLVMWQASISLLTVVVIAARAINTIGS
jgi:hypothetical protein